MNVILWIVQGLLALLFALHGWMMIFPAKEPMEWTSYLQAIPPLLRRVIGVLEVLAAIGLILPQMSSLLPWLTPMAAAGLAVLMVLAILFHVRRQEYANIGFNLILLILSAFVAYGRFVIRP